MKHSKMAAFAQRILLATIFVGLNTPLAEAQNNPVAGPPSVTTPPATQPHRSAVRLFAGPTMAGAKLQGEGFTATEPYATGTNAGLQLDYGSTKSPALWSFRWLSSRARLETADVLTPRNIQVNREETHIAYSSFPFGPGWFDQVRIGVGYGMVNYKSEATTPNVALTSQKTQGLSIHVSQRWDLFESAEVETALSVSLPHQLQEDEALSGYNPRLMGVEASFIVDCGINADWAVTVGGIYRRDSSEFQGQGTRGTIDAKDSRTTFLLPIGLKYAF